MDEKETNARIGDKIFIKHLDGPLFFGFASRFQELTNKLPEVELVLIRMDKVPYVDQSGLYAMEDAILELQDAGVEVIFINVHDQPLDMFLQFSLIPNLIPEEHCFANMDEFFRLAGCLDEG